MFLPLRSWFKLSHLLFFCSRSLPRFCVWTFLFTPRVGLLQKKIEELAGFEPQTFQLPWEHGPPNHRESALSIRPRRPPDFKQLYFWQFFVIINAFIPAPSTFWTIRLAKWICLNNISFRGFNRLFWTTGHFLILVPFSGTLIYFRPVTQYMFFFQMCVWVFRFSRFLQYLPWLEISYLVGN